MTVSIALCTYNGEKFLSQQLESILSQSFLIDELIICDDGSNDNTLGIIESFKNQYPGILYLHQNEKSLGTIKNFEKAISLTNGDLIFLADQDDIWHNNKVEIMSTFFQENSNCKLLFSDGDLIDENGHNLNATLWQKWDFSAEMQSKWKNNKKAFEDLIINNNKVTGATVCFHKSLKEVGLPIEVPYGYWHDVFLGIHASAVDGLMFISQSLIKYRIHHKQQVGIKNDFDKKIIDKSNPYPITKKEFYNKIKKKHPRIKGFLPKQSKKSILIRIRLKLKKIINYFIKN